MTRKEPIRFRDRKSPTAISGGGRLFTCGRPGRGTFGTKKFHIDDSVVDLWVQGLPRLNIVNIVSLLGTKPDGYSEFGYYSFRSSEEKGEMPTFQESINERYRQRSI